MDPIATTDHAETPRGDDLEHLHAGDLHAARIVVGLMTGVFLIGLLMYSFIFWIVM